MFEHIELFIFDLDGTLIEFHQDYLVEQALGIIPKLGYHNILREELDNAFYSFDLFRFVKESEREEFMEKFWNLFDWTNFPKPSPFPESLLILKELNKIGKRLAIATSRLSELDELKSILNQTPLMEYISHVECRTDPQVHWTDKRDLIKKVCSEIGVLPEHSAMVGDIPTDIQSARDVGISRLIAVKSGGIAESILRDAKPDLLLENVGEITEFLAL